MVVDISNYIMAVAVRVHFLFCRLKVRQLFFFFNLFQLELNSLILVDDIGDWICIEEQVKTLMTIKEGERDATYKKQ